MKEYFGYKRIILSPEVQGILETLRVEEVENQGVTIDSSLYSKFIGDLSSLDEWIAEHSKGKQYKPFPDDIKVSANEYFHQIEGELGNHYGYKYVFNFSHKYLQAKIKELHYTSKS